MRLKLETNFSVFEQPKHRIKMSAQCSLRTVGPMCCFCSPEELYHSPGTVRQAGDSLEGRIEPWTPGVHVRLRATHPLCYPVSIIASSYIAGYPYLLHFPHPPPQPSNFLCQFIVFHCFRMPIEQRADYQPNREGGYMFVCCLSKCTC